MDSLVIGSYSLANRKVSSQPAQKDPKGAARDNQSFDFAQDGRVGGVRRVRCSEMIERNMELFSSAASAIDDGGDEQLPQNDASMHRWRKPARAAE